MRWYGRPRIAVEADLTAAVAEIGAINRLAVERAVSTPFRPGNDPVASATRPARNMNRTKKEQGRHPQQANLIDEPEDQPLDALDAVLREAGTEQETRGETGA